MFYGDYKKLRTKCSLLAYFWHPQFNEMDRFPKERPCLNPPHQRDLLDNNDHPILEEECDSAEVAEDNDSVAP